MIKNILHISDGDLPLGKGLSADSSDSLCVDAAAAFVWTGPHVFSVPLVLSPAQCLPARNLASDSEALGGLLCFTAAGWDALPVGAAGQILTVVGGSPTWGKLDLSWGASGLLSAACGGTGLNQVKAGDMLVSPADGRWSALPVGSPGDILTSTAAGPAWSAPRGLSGAGSPGHVPIWDAAGSLSSSALSCGEDALGQALLRFAGRAPHIRLDHDGSAWFAWDSDGGKALIAACPNGAPAATLSVSPVALAWGPLGGEPAFAVDSAGLITHALLPASQVRGTLAPSQGGTGASAYEEGDLLFADGPQSLTRLTTRGAEGMVLTVLGGRPSWSAPGQGGDFGGKVLRPVALAPGSAAGAGLLLGAGPVSSQPQPGAVEFDGKALLFTDDAAQRRPLAFQDSDISGRSAGISRPLTLDFGGLGADLSSGTPGALLVLSGAQAAWLAPSTQGLFLQSAGDGAAPNWASAVTQIHAGNGAVVALGDDGHPSVRVDTSAAFAPTWEGEHRFLGGTRFAGPVTALSPILLSAAMTPAQPKAGSLWFDGQHLCFRRDEAETVLLTASAPDRTPARHYIPLLQGADPERGQNFKMRVPLPYGPDGPARWRFCRLEFRTDAAPNDGGAASATVLLGSVPITDPDLRIETGSESTFADGFVQSVGASGELLQVRATETAGSSVWSVYILIEEVLS